MAGTVLPFHGNALKKWHVSEADLEIQDKITQYAGNYEGTVMLVAPEHVMEQARLQNDNIILLIDLRLFNQILYVVWKKIL